MTHSITTAAALLLTTLATPHPPTKQAGTFDSNWTITVEGQTVQADADGTFRIQNVSAPDQFGPLGPGTFPDQVSDEYVRVTAIRQGPGGPEYAFSDPFLLAQGATQLFSASDFTFTSTPPPLPISVMISLDLPVLTGLAQVAQATVTAVLPSGQVVDVTAGASWTTYTTSNPNVVTVGPDGTITATGSGSAFVTAINDGATTIAGITVQPGDPGTTVVGAVLDGSEAPVSGATVTVQGQGLSGATAADGQFAIPGVLSELGDLSLKVEGLVGPDLLIEFVSGLEPQAGAFTDAGVVVLAPSQGSRFLYLNNSPYWGSGVPNSVSAFRILGDGQLDELSGSPWSTGELGGAAPHHGDSIVATQDGRFLIVLNEKSGTLTSFAVGPAGGLTEVPGSPIATAGVYKFPMAITSQGFCFTAKEQGSTKSIARLRVEDDGSLTDLGNPFPAPVQTFLREITANAAGDRLFVLLGFGGILTLGIDGAGALTELSEFPNAGGILTLEPSLDGSVLYAPYYSGGISGDLIIPAFQVLASGDLVQIGSSQIPITQFTNQVVPMQMAPSPDGGRLFLSSHVPVIPGLLHSLEIGGDELIVEPVAPGLPTGGNRPKTPVVTADGNYLYLLNSSPPNPSLVSYAIQPDGSLLPLGTPLALGLGGNDAPSGLVIVD